VLEAARDLQEARMSSGTVRWFNASKGFGFIAPDDGGPDIFVHASALERGGISELNEVDQVSFDVQEDRRSGTESAANLRVTGASPTPPRRPTRAPWGEDQRESFLGRSSGHSGVAAAEAR
jgi:cold shock protein